MAPFAWSISAGLLPNGLALDPVTGILSGTPQVAGTFNFTVSVSDYYGAADSQAYALTIIQPLMIVNTSLPEGIVNAAYPATQLIAAGGSPGYTFSILSGALPAGLSMTAGGLITGTPTATGSTGCTLRVTDSLAAIASRAFTIVVGTPPDTPQWNQRALYGGSISRLVFSPDYANDGIVFTASGYGAEIYKSADRGANWQRILTDYSNAGQYITGMALSPVFKGSGLTTDEKTVYVSGWSIGVWKSVDGGLTFTENSNGLVSIYNIDALAVSPNYVNDRTLWLAKMLGSNEIHISTDAAASWQLAGTLPTSNTAIDIIPSPNYAVDQTLFVYTSDQVYKSVNGGTNWVSVYNPGSGITNLAVSPDFKRDRTLWINAGAGELHRSRDAGATWSVLATPGYALDTVARPASPTPWLYMRGTGTTAPYNLLRSDNQGDSFVPLYAQSMLPTSASPGSRALSLSPLLPGPAADVFSGSSAGVTASFDDGLSFNSRQKGLTAMDVNDVCGGGGAIVAATSYGWLKSVDNGASWGQAVNSPGLAPGGARACALSPNFANDDTMFLSAGSIGKLHRSTDAGVSFTEVFSFNAGAIALVPGFNPATGIVYIASSSSLYRSTNGGQTFTQVPLGVNCDAGSISYIAVSPNYATDGAVFISREDWGAVGDGTCRTTDFGATWTRLFSTPLPRAGTVWLPPNYNDDVISAAYSRTIILIYGSTFSDPNYTLNGIWRSTDNGATWVRVSGQPATPKNIVYGRATFSPNFATDQTVLVSVLNAYHEGDGVWRSSDGGASFAPLNPATDELFTRSSTALFLTPGFNGGNTVNSIGVVGTQGSGLWRTTDGGRTFHSVTDMVFASKFINAYASRPQTGTPLYAATSDSGVWSSDDGGLTFASFSRGLPKNSNALSIVAPTALPDNPLTGVAGRGLWRWGGSNWINLAGLTTGTYTSFTQDGTYLYTSRADGVSLRSSNGGVTWSGLQGAETTLTNIAYNGSSGPTLATAAVAGGNPQTTLASAPKTITAVNTASLWSVAQSAGPRYSLNSGTTWIATPGGNDYALPGAQTYSIVQPLGINAISGSREVAAGTTTGLYLSRDAGVTWRSVTGTGSGLEATSKNFSAVLATTTAYSTTDLLVGATGSTTGGVYLSGDGGVHWTQLNAGFDPNNLSISSLVTTSCTGCPVQYYSGSYGGGLYTRTIAVVAPPFYTTGASWCTGAGCVCAATTATLQIGGGQTFKICGSNFQNGLTVEFDGVPATGCTQAVGTTITCTGSPAHAAGGAQVQVRNPDTRAKYLPANAFQFSGGASRTVNSLRLSKAGADAGLAWTCAGCTAGAPARVYRAQDTVFSLFLEQYNGGTGGAYTNTGAVSSVQNYFWTVE